MVSATPFQRLINQVAEMANKNPPAAWVELEKLWPTLTEQDVQQLGTLATHLGATVLGRYNDVLALQKCINHAAVETDGG